MKSLTYLILCITFFCLLARCSVNDPNDGSKGRITLSLTDAPLDVNDITAVSIAIAGIEIKDEKGKWKSIAPFDQPVRLNLLDYQNGNEYFLTEDEVEAGMYKEIRLLLNVNEDNSDYNDISGCYLEFKDGTTQPLFVPGGTSSGFKVKGDFTVFSGGVTAITLDFDAGKSVVMAGNSGKFILKPVIRVLENALVEDGK